MKIWERILLIAGCTVTFGLVAVLATPILAPVSFGLTFQEYVTLALALGAFVGLVAPFVINVD